MYYVLMIGDVVFICLDNFKFSIYISCIIYFYPGKCKVKNKTEMTVGSSDISKIWN